MHVTFRQSGGFAGLVRGCGIDAAALDPDERARLHSLVAASGLVAGSHATTAAAAARDLRHYEITIDLDGRRLSFSGDDRTLPAPIIPLIDWLRERSRPLRPDELPADPPA